MPGTGINFSASVRQTLEQTLSPQMQLGLKVLQKTALELGAEIRQEMSINPVIEEITNPNEVPLSSELPPSGNSSDVTEKELDFRPDGSEIGEVLGAGSPDDGYRDAFLGNLENASGDEEAQSRRDRMFDSMVSTETLGDHLLSQVYASDISVDDRPVAETIIGDLDDDGYLHRPLEEIAMVTGADEPRILRVLSAIRQFDPPGCGSRDLRECWLSQMDKLDDSPWEDDIRLLLEHHFELLSGRRQDAVCRLLDITPGQYAQLLKELKTLDPFPGRTFAAAAARTRFSASENGFVQTVHGAEYIKPELFAVPLKGGGWTVRVDSRDIPPIRISRRYQDMLEDHSLDSEAKSYIRERIRAANALRDAVARRQETIENIADTIAKAQPDFYEKGLAALRPLTQSEVARKVGVANTTVSRTVRNKYISTPHGVMPLARFFTAGLSTAEGGKVSNANVKLRIRELVKSENPAAPLSDEKIAAVLKTEGVDISRRTVAKYRKAMDIGGVSERLRPGYGVAKESAK